MENHGGVVSIVIPSYNHQDYIIKSIESVLGQDWPQIDLIVIDDGSTDATPTLLTNFHNKTKGFRLFLNKNKGLIKTLNEGLQIAMGEFFCVLASDDYLPPRSLSSRAAYLLANPDCIAVFGDAQELYKEKISDQRIMTAKRRHLFQMKDPIPEFIRGVNLPIHTLMTRVDVFRRIGGFDERYRYCEDLDPQLRLYLSGPIAFIDTPVYVLRRHLTNTTRTNPYVARVDKILMYRKYLDEVQELVPYKKEIRRQLRRQYLLLGRYLNKTRRDDLMAKELFKEAWRYSWKDMRLLWHLIRSYLY